MTDTNNAPDLVEAVARAERLARNADMPAVYKEARSRFMRDATGQDIEHHLIVVAGEFAIAAARPLIEQQERERCAKVVEAMTPPFPTGNAYIEHTNIPEKDAWYDAQDSAARVIRNLGDKNENSS